MARSRVVSVGGGRTWHMSAEVRQSLPTAAEIDAAAARVLGASAVSPWPADPRAAGYIERARAREIRDAQREAVDRATEWIFAKARSLGGIEHVDARRLSLELYP